jgi:hypothetical protein
MSFIDYALPPRFISGRYQQTRLDIFKGADYDMEYRFYHDNSYDILSLEKKSTKYLEQVFLAGSYRLVKFVDKFYAGHGLIMNTQLEIIGAIVTLRSTYENGFHFKRGKNRRTNIRPEAWFAFFSFEFVDSFPKEFSKIVKYLGEIGISIKIMSTKELNKTLNKKRNTIGHQINNPQFYSSLK